MNKVMDEVSESSIQIAELKAAEINHTPNIWTLAAVPTWALQTGGDNLLHIGAIQVCLHDAVQRHVRPENQLAAVVEVQGDGVLQIVEQQGILRAMRQNLADVDTVGKQQHRLWTYRTVKAGQVRWCELKWKRRIARGQRFKYWNLRQLEFNWGPMVTFDNRKQ